MNYYWWRSNGESGLSGNVLANNQKEAEKKVYRKFKEHDIFMVIARRNVKEREFKGIVYI